MNKNLTIGLLAVALAASSALLFLGSGKPGPIQDQEYSICEYRTIEFKLDKTDDGEQQVITAVPEVLNNVRECAQVIFVNQTDRSFSIVFKSGTGSPFSGIDEIKLDPVGEGNQFAKAFSVDLVPGENQDVDFPFNVEPGGDPLQSPRIRIGPKVTGTE